MRVRATTARKAICQFLCPRSEKIPGTRSRMDSKTSSPLPRRRRAPVLHEACGEGGIDQPSVKRSGTVGRRFIKYRGPFRGGTLPPGREPEHQAWSHGGRYSTLKNLCCAREGSHSLRLQQPTTAAADYNLLWRLKNNLIRVAGSLDGQIFVAIGSASIGRKKPERLFG